jgi:hypothetical protein
METKSISINGISVFRKGEENYSRFCAGAFRGTIYYQYDYRHLNGDLFTTTSQTLDECREKRDKWVQQKNYAGLFPNTLKKILDNKPLTKVDMGYQIGHIEPYHPASLYWNTMKRDEIVEAFNKLFGTEIK